jgi:site-specific recombinase XerD
MLASEATKHLEDYLISQGAADGTIRHLQQSSRKLIAFCTERNITGIDNMTYLHVREYWTWLRGKGLSVYGYARDLRRLFNFLYEDGLLEPPSNGHVIKKAGFPRDGDSLVAPASDEAILGLLQAAKQGRNPVRDELLILMQVDTGARIGELLSIDPRHINWAQRSVLIRGKGKRDRSLFFGKRVAALLRRYLRVDWERREPDREVLFQSRDGSPLTYNQAKKMLNRHGKAAGLSRSIGTHQLRHAYATKYKAAGGGDIALQRSLGHSTSAMTKRYAAMADELLRSEHTKAGPVDKLKR